MKQFSNIIKTSEDPRLPIANKEILWPGETGIGSLPNGDSDRFPDILAIKLRISCDQPTPLNSFKEAVGNAQRRVWIIDPYFLESDKCKCNRQVRIDQILNWMNETMLAYDIRILTNELEGHGSKEISCDVISQFQEHAELINSIRLPGEVRCHIEVRFTLNRTFNYVHDRFAIIDEELWHFGATVGGFHSQVSAATRGWRASDHGADEFFLLAWDGDRLKGKI
jgi:hypothetical protein